MSDIKAGKNFKKWRARNAGGDKPKETTAKVNKPFVLTYMERGRWAQWKELIADQAKYEFGVLGQLCETDAYPVLPEVDVTLYDLDNAHAEVAKMHRSLLLSAMQDREKSARLMILARPKLYSLFKAHLSPDSFALVLSYKDFDPTKDVNDPLKLWLAVKATHRAGSDAVDESNRRVDTITALHNCKQLADEMIHVYYERWKYSYDTYIAAGNNKYEDADQAQLFLNSASNAIYGPAKAELRNDKLKGVPTPKDLSGMYHFLCQYVVVRKDVKSNYGAAFATLGDQHHQSRPTHSGVPGKSRDGAKHNKKSAKSGGVNKGGGT